MGKAYDHRFLISWALLSAALFVLLTSAGLAPKNVSSIGKKVLASLVFAEDTSATEHALTVVVSQETENENRPAREESETLVSSGAGMEPERIIIEKIGVSSSITHPQTTDVRILNEELKKGVVQYPGSGYLNGISNIFLFAHSTGLRNVRNEAYRAFNNLGMLQIGDTITLLSGRNEYEYTVVSVTLARADDVNVQFSTDKKMLTLATCDTFGKKEDRFIITAEFVRQKALTAVPHT